MLGTGALSAPEEVSVQPMEGGEEEISTKNIMFATGSEVATLPAAPLDEEVIASSTSALKLDKIPEKMVVIGGAVIGLEMGSVWRRLGSEVIVVEFLNRILPVDKEIADIFLFSRSKR